MNLLTRNDTSYCQCCILKSSTLNVQYSAQDFPSLIALDLSSHLMLEVRFWPILSNSNTVKDFSEWSKEGFTKEIVQDLVDFNEGFHESCLHTLCSSLSKHQSLYFIQLLFKFNPKDAHILLYKIGKKIILSSYLFTSTHLSKMQSEVNSLCL